jgi:hypothetical protein
MIRIARYGVVLSLAVVSVAALGNPTEPQPKSPKELVKEALMDEQQGHWEAALEKLKIASNLKHKDKTISAELDKAKGHLADVAANQAIGSCNALKIDTCEQQLKLALSYAITPRTKEAQSQLAARKAELQKRWDEAEQMISSSQLEDANVELDGLSQYPYLFPALPAEKERLRRLRINADIDLGSKDLVANKFDDARKAFSAARALDPANTEAAGGIDAADKGNQAVHWNEEAKNAFSQKSYETAYLDNQKALALLPGHQEYLDFRKQIAAEWLKVLEDDHALNPDPNNLKDNQAAWESLGWIKRLDPSYKPLAEVTRQVKLHLYSIYSVKANTYQSSSNNSGVGIAYLYYLNAQMMNPDPGAGDAFAASFHDVTELFKRKRTMVLVVRVESLSQVPNGFNEVVTRRVNAAIEALGLPDLVASPADAYEKKPDVDALFQDIRPDGKSRVAALTLDITNYQKENGGYDAPEEKHSQFINGQVSVSNPEYEKLTKKVEEENTALERNHNKAKPTKEGYTASGLAILRDEMDKTPKQITRDKLVDYTYQEYHLSASVHIGMKLTLRDMLEKQLLASEDIEKTEQDTAKEIAGALAGDVNGIINRQPRIKTQEQMQQDAELAALKSIDEKLPALLAKYDQRYYDEGEKALQAGHTDDAVENFLCYWYTFRGQMDENRSRHIVEVVKQYTGLELSPSDSVLVSQGWQLDMASRAPGTTGVMLFEIARGGHR